MPDRVRDLPSFLEELAKLLDLISTCQRVLFREGFRTNLTNAIAQVNNRLRMLRENERVRNPREYEEMERAGLVGSQLDLKLESFETALVAFENEAGEERLRDVLDVSETILQSLTGGIPVFGSFAQELVAFILKELKKRFWWPGR